MRETSEVPNDPHGIVVCNLYRAVSHYDAQHPGTIHRYGGDVEADDNDAPELGANGS